MSSQKHSDMQFWLIYAMMTGVCFGVWQSNVVAAFFMILVTWPLFTVVSALYDVLDKWRYR